MKVTMCTSRDQRIIYYKSNKQEYKGIRIYQKILNGKLLPAKVECNMMPEMNPDDAYNFSVCLRKASLQAQIWNKQVKEQIALIEFQEKEFEIDL